MNPEKVGALIKKIRKDNNLTQQEFANKYAVTYQAVSKWENGVNLPELSLLKQISKDFGISLDDILEGEVTKKNNKNNKKIIIIVLISIIILLVVGFIIHHFKDKDNTFEFKTLSTTCEEFKVNGSIAYDNKKSSIYISHIDYCKGDDNTVYKKIECNLYEQNLDTTTKISTCNSKSNVKLEDYLKEVELKVDNYLQVCKNKQDYSLFLEINATLKDDKIVTYKVPLKFNENCEK